MAKTYHITAAWDGEAKVFVSKSDLQGLHVEAATLTEFADLAQALSAELLSDAAGRPVEVRLTGAVFSLEG